MSYFWFFAAVLWLLYRRPKSPELRLEYSSGPFRLHEVSLCGTPEVLRVVVCKPFSE